MLHLLYMYMHVCVCCKLSVFIIEVTGSLHQENGEQNVNLSKKIENGIYGLYIYVQEASNLMYYINLEHGMDNILNIINSMLTYFGNCLVKKY